MANKDVKYINSGKPLDFDLGGFAINPLATTPNNNAWRGDDFRDMLLAISGTGNVIVYGSTQVDPPDFSAPASISNFYVPIVLADYSLQNTYYNGTVGVTVAGSQALVELNTNLLSWIAIKRSVGTVDVKFTQTNAL